MSMLSEFETMNFEYLKKIEEETSVQVKKFPDEVLEKFREISKKVITELTKKDEMSKKIYDSYSKFQKDIKRWSTLNTNY